MAQSQINISDVNVTSYKKKLDTTHIVLGIRGDPFKAFIESLLIRGRLRSEFRAKILDDEGMILYNKAFTSETADPNNNYEYLEALGDGIANTAILWSISRAFPQLDCSIGATVISKLKSKYVSKKAFSSIGEGLGMFDYISAREGERLHRKRPLIEDTFEAFLAATNILLDKKIKQGVGYPICYSIVNDLMTPVLQTETLNYDSLYDSKTILPEIIAEWPQLKGYKPQYRPERVEAERGGNRIQITHVSLYLAKPIMSEKEYIGKIKELASRGNTKDIVDLSNQYSKSLEGTFYGEGSAALQQDAEQKAAGEAIRKLAKLGFTKTIKPEYLKLCTFSS